MAIRTTCLILCCFLVAHDASPVQAQDSKTWPGPIPCRVQDEVKRKVRTVLEDGKSSPRAGEVKFTLQKLESRP